MEITAATRKTLMLLVSACCAAILHPAQAQDALSKIKTIVVIYAENRSFDHLYGLFPGANGFSNATTEQKTQLDHDSSALPYLTVFASGGKPDADSRECRTSRFALTRCQSICL